MTVYAVKVGQCWYTDTKKSKKDYKIEVSPIKGQFFESGDVAVKVAAQVTLRTRERVSVVSFDLRDAPGEGKIISR
jgi:hypothetical protein